MEKEVKNEGCQHLLREQLKRHEGFKLRVYKCTAGHSTIGCGYNLDANPAHLKKSEIDDMMKNGISEAKANYLLDLMIAMTETDLVKKLDFFTELSEPLQALLVNMAYNMGVNGLLKFKNTLAHIRTGSYDEAADEMLNSKWAKQVGNRAFELSKQMRTGRFA